MRALLMAVLIIVGLVVAGSIVVWAVHALLSVLFWVVVAALAVGAVVFVAGRVRKAVGGPTRRQVR
jgi:membrane-associated phospholipid phosphatase